MVLLREERTDTPPPPNTTVLGKTMKYTIFFLHNFFKWQKKRTFARFLFISTLLIPFSANEK